MLRDIKELFIERKSMNIKDLTIHFKISENALDGMLQLLIEKNIIEKIEMDCDYCKSSCGNCSFAKQKEIYKLVMS